ncbi:hypothetical protein GGI35DRAFT_179662 [Trichoderma velutinum]
MWERQTTFALAWLFICLIQLFNLDPRNCLGQGDSLSYPFLLVVPFFSISVYVKRCLSQVGSLPRAECCTNVRFFEWPLMCPSPVGPLHGVCIT